jgi:hypothetical protein
MNVTNPVMWHYQGWRLKHLISDMLTWCLHCLQEIDNQYSDPAMFECLQCAEGCESCEDDRPCIVSLNWVMRTAILILSCVIICCLPAVVLFTWKYGNVKVGPNWNELLSLYLHETCNREQSICKVIYIAAVGTVWSLLGSPWYGQSVWYICIFNCNWVDTR